MAWAARFLSYLSRCLSRQAPQCWVFCGVQVSPRWSSAASRGPPHGARAWLPFVASCWLWSNSHILSINQGGPPGCVVALDIILLQRSSCPDHPRQERFSPYSEGCPLSPPGGLCDKFSWKYLCLGVGSRYPQSHGPPNWRIHSCPLISTRGPPQPLLKAIEVRGAVMSWYHTWQSHTHICPISLLKQAVSGLRIVVV